MWRWAVVLVAVLVLHWIAAEWVQRTRDTFAPEPPVHAPVQVALLTPEKIEQKPAEPAASHPAPVQPKTAPSQPRPHVLTATRAQPAAAVVASTAAVQAASEVAANAAAEAASAAAAAAAAAASSTAGNGSGTRATSSQAASQPGASAPASGVKFSVPPSGDLQYDTFYNGVRNQPGTIHWSSDGKTHYEMVVAIPLPFVGTFSYSSHGHIDAFGLAPDQYIEKRGRRPEDVSIFNRTTKQIVFTKTPASLPLTDGAQDRFSMVMQLASLVRGDPDVYKPGVTRQFFVVDNDSGENWPIETIGDETIRTAQGYVGTRHFMRLPRHDGDRRRIDVWLAPSLGWLPARIMQTEPNGTEIELVWNGPLSVPVDNSANAAAVSADHANGAAASPSPSSSTASATSESSSEPASQSAREPASEPSANTPATPPVPAPAPAPQPDAPPTSVKP